MRSQVPSQPRSKHTLSPPPLSASVFRVLSPHSPLCYSLHHTRRSVGSAWHLVQEAPQGMLPAPPTRRKDTLTYQTRCQKGAPGLLGCGRKVSCTQQSRVCWWPPPHTKRWLPAASQDPRAGTTLQQTGMPACLQVPKICRCPNLFCMKACRQAQGCWARTMCYT